MVQSEDHTCEIIVAARPVDPWRRPPRSPVHVAHGLATAVGIDPLLPRKGDAGKATATAGSTYPLDNLGKATSRS